MSRRRGLFGLGAHRADEAGQLVLDAVQVRLGGRTVLEDVRMVVGPGELVALVGANGAGKSTLLRTAAGLAPLAAGDVRLDGRTLQRWPDAELARARSVLVQDAEIAWPMRARDVVALGRLPYAAPWWSGDEAARDTADAAAIDRAMARTGVTALADRVIATLSGGERARVLLARALAVDARFVLADEPTASLDPAHQLDVLRELRNEAQSGRGVIVVLHDLTLASRFCDRVVVLVDGRVIIDAPPQWALNDSVLKTAFGVEVVRGERDGERWVMPWTAG
jgi:iron complex transport system ATP-binding protein